MTETDIPLLGPGRDQTQAWSQAAMAIGSALRERRFALGRHAWSDERAAERVAHGHRQAADPPVRDMSEPEFDLFRREGSAGRPGYETRQTSGSHGDVRVTVGPMPEGRGWGLAADAAAPPDAETGQPGVAAAQARVVAKTEAEAKELADELLTGGHARVQRLHEFGQYAARRAAKARTEVRETRDQLLHRTADAIRHVWSADPQLAERMIRGDERDTERGINDALPALARELEKLEDRGYAMGDVLSRIDRHDSLRRADNPAAMAQYFVKALAPDLQVINLDHTDEAEHRQDAEHGGPTESARPRAGRPDRSGPPAESVAAAEDALDAALRAAELPMDSVRTARGFPRLQTLLAEQHSQGRDLDPLLAGLPSRRLSDAKDPAAYLRAVVESRLGDNPLRKTRPDLHSAAELVERCLPRDTSRAVTEGDSWPGLATRLGQWRSEGLPVTTMLESLPADRIRTATDPAQYASQLLNAKAVSHRSQPAPDSGADRRVVDPDWPGGPEPTTAATQPAPTPAGPEVTAETAMAVIDMDRSPTAIALPGAAVDQLDPASAVDRVALQAARGTGNARHDEAIERLLATSSRSTGDPEAAAATAHAERERDRAEAADRDAAHAAATPDDPATAEREDLTGHEQAHSSDWDADQARAIADSDLDLAAAARADLSYRTASGPSAAGSGRSVPRQPKPGQAAAAARAQPTRAVTPTQAPVRTPRPRR